MVKGKCSDCPRTEDHWFCKGRCAACHKRFARRMKRPPQKCVVCGADIDSSAEYASPRKRLCSPECKQRHQTLARRGGKQAPPCLVCGSVDPERRPDARYCSEKCARTEERRLRLVQRGFGPCRLRECGQPIGAYGNKGMCRRHARIAQRAARPAHYRAKLEARRKRVRQATPKWVDLRAIELIYEGCPTGHEVDHIVPLKGESVSGLHVPWNLQYLPVSDNRKKGNRPPEESPCSSRI